MCVHMQHTAQNHVAPQSLRCSALAGVRSYGGWIHGACSSVGRNSARKSFCRIQRKSSSRWTFVSCCRKSSWYLHGSRAEENIWTAREEGCLFLLLPFWASSKTPETIMYSFFQLMCELGIPDWLFAHRHPTKVPLLCALRVYLCVMPVQRIRKKRKNNSAEVLWCDSVHDNCEVDGLWSASHTLIWDSILIGVKVPRMKPRELK